MSLANPCALAYQIPTAPTTTVMNTLITAPPSMIQSASETGEHASRVTPHTKTSSTARATGSDSSTPEMEAITPGNMQARLATHRGKLTQ